MERFQRWHPGCPPHPAGGADHGTHSDLPNDGGRGHYLGSLIQMSLHWFVGPRPLGGAIHRIHMLEHHGIYSGDALVADTYSDEEQSATAYYAAPAVALVGAAYATLPLDIFVVLVAALSASYAAHVYVHTQTTSTTRGSGASGGSTESASSTSCTIVTRPRTSV